MAPRKTTRPRRRADVVGDRASSARRDEIVRIAAELFAEQGYQGTSVRDIADRADILSGSLFHHFHSKESILEEIVGTPFDQMVTRCVEISNSDLPADEALIGIITATVEMIQENPIESQIIQREWQHLVKTYPRFAKNFDTYWHACLSVLERGVTEGLFRSDLDLQIANRLIRGALSEVMNWYKPKSAKNPDTNVVIDTYVGLLLGGLRVRQRRKNR